MTEAKKFVVLLGKNLQIPSFSAEQPCNRAVETITPLAASPYTSAVHNKQGICCVVGFFPVIIKTWNWCFLCLFWFISSAASHKIKAETLIRQVKWGEHSHCLTTLQLNSNKTQGEGKIFCFLKAHGEFQQPPLIELSTACFQLLWGVQKLWKSSNDLLWELSLSMEQRFAGHRGVTVEGKKPQQPVPPIPSPVHLEAQHRWMEHWWSIQLLGRVWICPGQ